MFNFHPPLTVFPSALLVVVLGLEVVNLFRPFEPAARRLILLLLLLAVLGVVAAFFSGYQASEIADQTFKVDNDAIDLHHSLGRWLLLLSLPLAGLGFVVEIATHGKVVFKTVYLLVLVACTALVVATGFYGGRLVFAHGAGVYAELPKEDAAPSQKAP